MGDELVFAGFGGALAIVGICLIYIHVRSHRSHEQDTEISDVDRRFLNRQYSRRMQTSSLAVFLGALISIGGSVTVFKQSPWMATIYVCILLMLSLWLMLLGVGDAIASRMHAQRQNRAGARKHTNLADALAEVRATYGIGDSDATDQTEQA